MRTIIFFTVLVFSMGNSFAQNQNYSCKYNDEDGRQRFLEVFIKDNLASINLQTAQSRIKKSNCNVKKEEFGTLIECNQEGDLMILINQVQNEITGGIMSESLNLYVDIKC